MGYDAMTLGNHEFNFGSDVFKGVLGQAKFPVLGANVSDTGAYGLAAADGGDGVKPYVEKDLDGIKVAVLGITNHRVPNYELPSNIPGLTFSDPIGDGAGVRDRSCVAKGDVVVALTHIGFTENPKSVEVDKNVDTNMAADGAGLDAIIGSHSHTDPRSRPPTRRLQVPAHASSAGRTTCPGDRHPGLPLQQHLGEVVLGMRAKAGGGYEVVSRRPASTSRVTTHDRRGPGDSRRSSTRTSRLSTPTTTRWSARRRPRSTR